MCPRWTFAALDVLPRALTAAYVALGIHGLLLLAGADLALAVHR